MYGIDFDSFNWESTEYVYVVSLNWKSNTRCLLSSTLNISKYLKVFFSHLWR